MIAPVVDLAWWQEHRSDVVTADVRWYLDGRSGADAFAAGHLPGARFVDLDRWLAGPASPAAGRHPLPEPAVFAEGMARNSIGHRDVVVAYDDDGGLMAGRLVWLLRVTGHPAALLDGGLAAYDGALETGPVTPARASFGARPWPQHLLAEIDEASDPDNVVLDARAVDRFRGEQEPVDPRAGHIPGARSLPARDTLRPDGRLLPAADLRRRFAEVGVGASTDVISSCGSGVTACHTLLVLEHVGFRPGRLYAGSWSQYSHTDRPAATG
jgi:thiosulfate/3-mercaptopyruvate sulfurtransferase